MVKSIFAPAPNATSNDDVIFNPEYSEIEAMRYFEQTMYQAQKALYALANIGVNFTFAFTLPALQIIPEESKQSINVMHFGDPLQILNAAKEQILSGEAILHQDTERKYIHKDMGPFWQPVPRFISEEIQMKENDNFVFLKQSYEKKFDVCSTVYLRTFKLPERNRDKWTSRFASYQWGIDRNETKVLKLGKRKFDNNPYKMDSPKTTFNIAPKSPVLTDEIYALIANDQAQKHPRTEDSLAEWLNDEENGPRKKLASINTIKNTDWFDLS